MNRDAVTNKREVLLFATDSEGCDSSGKVKKYSI